jgi:hypothetical protein
VLVRAARHDGTANPTRGDHIRVTACSETVGLLVEGPRRIDDSGELTRVDILGSQLNRARTGPRGLLESPTTMAIGRHVAPPLPSSAGATWWRLAPDSCSPTPEEQPASWA